jgi:hypothetical protein
LNQHQLFGDKVTTTLAVLRPHEEIAMRTRKTKEVLVLLGVSYDMLFNRIRTGQIKPPGRDVSGHYAWSDKAIAAARRAVAIDRRSKAHRRQIAGGQS